MTTEEIKIVLLKKSDDAEDDSDDKNFDPEEDEKEIFDPNEVGLDDLGVEEIPEDKDNPLETGEDDGNY